MPPWIITKTCLALAWKCCPWVHPCYLSAQNSNSVHATISRWMSSDHIHIQMTTIGQRNANNTKSDNSMTSWWAVTQRDSDNINHLALQTTHCTWLTRSSLTVQTMAHCSMQPTTQFTTTTVHCWQCMQRSWSTELKHDYKTDQCWQQNNSQCHYHWPQPAAAPRRLIAQWWHIATVPQLCHVGVCRDCVAIIGWLSADVFSRMM